MGNSCCGRGSNGDELPKPPVRQPSDGDVKFKLVQELGGVRPPDETEHGGETVHVPVSSAES